jgi:hypothetical protein
MVITRQYLMGLPLAVLAIVGSLRLLGELASDLAMIVGFGGLVVLRFTGRR